MRILLICALLLESEHVLGLSHRESLPHAGQPICSEAKNTHTPIFPIPNIQLRGGREIQDIKFTSMESSTEDSFDQTDGHQYMPYTISVS
jgi:hypothetical protein